MILRILKNQYFFQNCSIKSIKHTVIVISNFLYYSFQTERIHHGKWRRLMKNTRDALSHSGIHKSIDYPYSKSLKDIVPSPEMNKTNWNVNEAISAQSSLKSNDKIIKSKKGEYDFDSVIPRSNQLNYPFKFCLERLQRTV